MRQNRFKSVAGLVSSLGTKQNDKSEFVLSIITAVISLFPLVYGLSYFTFVGALITMALVSQFVAGDVSVATNFASEEIVKGRISFCGRYIGVVSVDGQNRLYEILERELQAKNL